MAINYCVNCGEKLEEGQKECTSCGEPVPERLLYTPSEPEGSASTANTTQDDADAEKSNPAFFADLSGFDVFNTNPDVAPAERLYATPPDRTDVMAPVKAQRTVTEFRAPEERKSHLTLPIKIAAGIAAAMLLVAGVGLLSQPETQESIQRQIEESDASSSAVIEDNPSSEPSEAAESSSSASSALSVSDADAYVDDDTAFDILTSTYDSLQSYNERVYSCMQTYNGVYLVSDKTQREAAAGIASSLLAEMETELKKLDSMNIGKASSIYDDYENVRRLLNDQYMRLSPLVESWEISLGYDAPYEHQTEILEPLTRDVGASGQNTYLEDFDATYWDSRPTR